MHFGPLCNVEQIKKWRIVRLARLEWGGKVRVDAEGDGGVMFPVYFALFIIGAFLSILVANVITLVGSAPSYPM
ncbi:hypothetical protein HAX54_017253, partial [Datura stramonium]|nr:hypothetical protein [Datura stramonium]